MSDKLKNIILTISFIFFNCFNTINKHIKKEYDDFSDRT